MVGKICLAMVVANERPVIERCLDSVKNLIDQLCISINDDNDGTQLCIENWGKQNSIPTTIWYDPWKGYGPNKTRNLLKVKTELETEYILFLDADEVFITDPNNLLSYPTKKDAQKLFAELDSQPSTDVFYMDTHYGSHIYERWQIVRNNQVWIWRMPWQEYLVGEKSNNRSSISWLYNCARHEGHSSRHPDLESNIYRLEEWLKQNPESSDAIRATFYLGQGYKDCGKYEQAIVYLKQRLSQEGWSQERYIAALYLADIYKRMANASERRTALLKCIEIDPSRLEAFCELMNDDAEMLRFRSALAWGIMGPNSRVPPKGAFLINKKLYEWYYDYRMSIIAYYAAVKKIDTEYTDTGIFQIGLDAINRCMEYLPPTEKAVTLKNKHFYTDNLPNIHRSTRDVSVIIIENFYSDPHRIRGIALNMQFEVRGNYPGARTVPYIEAGVKEKIQEIVGSQIVYWPSQYNGSFQYTTADHKSWIHRDLTEWSLVVYLTPDAPVDGGTKLYIHKATGVTKATDSDTEKLLNNDSNNHDAWHVLDKIGNRFNRAILFKGTNSHMSDKYFGSNLKDCRLFQTFFFNTVDWQR